MRRRLSILVVLAIGALTAGCGGSMPSSRPPSTTCPNPFLTAPSAAPLTRIEGPTTSGGCAAPNR